MPFYIYFLFHDVYAMLAFAFRDTLMPMIASMSYAFIFLIFSSFDFFFRALRFDAPFFFFFSLPAFNNSRHQTNNIHRNGNKAHHNGIHSCFDIAYAVYCCCHAMFSADAAERCRRHSQYAMLPRRRCFRSIFAADA